MTALTSAYAVNYPKKEELYRFGINSVQEFNNYTEYEKNRLNHAVCLGMFHDATDSAELRVDLCRRTG